MADLVTKLRRAIEAALPWYDPEREAAKDREVAEVVLQAKIETSRLGSYRRVRVHQHR